MVSAWNLKSGMLIKFNDQPFLVVDVQISVQQQRKAAIQTKLKNFATGAIIEQRFNSTDEIERIRLDEKKMEYLYESGGLYYFMDHETYEQHPLSAEDIGENVKFLKENTVVVATYYEGRLVSVELPHTVELKVIETAPPIKGATVTNVFKPATVETGAVVLVPPFVEVGDVIRVDTRDGKYLERA